MGDLFEKDMKEPMGFGVGVLAFAAMKHVPESTAADHEPKA